MNCSLTTTTGKTASLEVPILYLGQVGAISYNGSTASTQSIGCGLSPITFSCGAATNATFYNWDISSLPGWSIISGQGTTTVQVQPSLGTGGTLKVRATRNDAPAAYTDASINISRPVAGPSLVLSGDGYLCEGNTKTYSLMNMPPTATVTSWDVSPNLTSVTSGNQIQLSYGSNGAGYVIASIDDGCGTQTTRYQSINVGTPPSALFTVNYQTFSPGVNNYLCTGTNVYLDASGSGYTWYNSSFNWSVTSGNSYAASLYNTANTANFTPYGNGYFNIELAATNTCGTTYSNVYFYAYDCYARYAVSPNPARDQIKISFDKIEDASALPDQIELFSEKSKTAVLSIDVQELYKSKRMKDDNTIELETSNLPRGIYYLHIKNSRNKENPLNIQRIILE